MGTKKLIRKKTTFIEFFGIPGSGKSTISKELVNQMSKMFKVSSPSYDIVFKHGVLIRTMIKFYRLFVFFLCHPLKLRKLIALIRNNKYTGIAGLKMLLNGIQKLYYYSLKKYDYVILDEGLTQFAISLSVFNYDKSYINEKIMREIIGNNDMYTIIKIYINSDAEQALKKLDSRHSNKSRVEKISSDKKMGLIINFLNACEDIKQKDNLVLCINYNYLEKNRVVSDILLHILPKNV